jgi:hypothetical protein
LNKKKCDGDVIDVILHEPILSITFKVIAGILLERDTLLDETLP